MILHLVPDEKVVPRAIEQFEKVSPNNNFFICFKNKNLLARFVKESHNVVYEHNYQFKDCNLSSITLVCIHFLDGPKLKFYYKHKLNRKTTLVILWGADVFNSYLLNRGFDIYSDNNSYLLDHVRYHTEGVPKVLKPIVKISKIFRAYIQDKKERQVDELKGKFFTNDVDYMNASVGQYKLLSRTVQMNRLKGFVEYTYYPIEVILGELKGLWCYGNNIMIGNSASFTNNHEYVYEYISNLDLRNFTVTIPMNYGGNILYNEIISSKFEHMSGCSIVKEFLPLNEYNKLMLKTSTFIYGNFRGEATGNILIALYLGGKVYMSRKSPLYEDLLGKGFVIFELETIQNTFNDTLSNIDKINNRQIALTNYSAEKNEEYVRIICNLS